jgi:hypothetical protein
MRTPAWHWREAAPTLLLGDSPALLAMAVDHIRYDLLAQDALRGVVQRVLADVAKNGFPGEHHLYITFDTRASGVRISPRLRELYPEDLTIVLQHQFWDLVVTEDGFEVGLSFKGVPERVAVPFPAIKGFFDPSVQFGLKFEVAAEPAEGSPAAPEEAPAPVPTEAPDAKRSRPPRPKSPKLPVATEASTAPAQPDSSAKSSDNEGPDRPTGGEVVRLDRFRKK